jgi:ABC-type polysaccharide/polyol phosphate export permease
MSESKVLRTGESARSSEIANFMAGFGQVNLWLHLTQQTVASRFRGSYFGAWWLVVSQLAFAGGVGFVWARIFNLDPSQFIPFVAIGFAMWGFFNGCVVDGCSALVGAGGYAKQMRLPLSVFIIRQFASHFFYLMIGLTVAAAVSLIAGINLLVNLAMAAPGIVLVGLAMLWTVGLVSFIGARFRDLAYGIGNLFQVLFVLTPVIYPPNVLEERGLHIFVYGNPLAAMLDVVRQPMILGVWADPLSYLVVAGFAAVMCAATLLIVNAWGRRVVYWL